MIALDIYQSAALRPGDLLEDQRHNPSMLWFVHRNTTGLGLRITNEDGVSLAGKDLANTLPSLAIIRPVHG